MPNYWTHHRKRNSTSQFPKLDIRKITNISNQETRGAKRLTATLADGNQIEVTSTPCNYGGVRYWWKCPGCGGRIACLYQYKGAYRCRHCLNAVHASTQSAKKDRNLDQMWKTIDKYNLYETWGVDGFTRIGEWCRPEGIGRKTWWRIVEKHNQRQDANMDGLRTFLGMVNRHE